MCDTQKQQFGQLFYSPGQDKGKKHKDLSLFQDIY
jgi:hypothetical protein